MSTRPAWVLAGGVAICVLAACGKGESKQESNEPKGIDFPEWVMKGSGAFGGEKRVFYGVGSVSGIKNHALARATADNRARAEIAKIFEVYSASLMKDYMASTTAGDMSKSSEEQHVEQAIKTFSAQTLSGVQIANHWFHPDGTIYALAQLDLAALTDNLSQMKELNAKVRDYVRKNAERVHMDLEKEEDKRAAPRAAAEVSPPAKPAPEPAKPAKPAVQTSQTKLALDDTHTVDITVVRGPPAVVGCADGEREAFADLAQFPTLAGCLATWSAAVSLRARKTGALCGDDIGPCAAPADSCGPGWRVCADGGAVQDLMSRTNASQCEHAAAGGSFVAAASHCAQQSGCEYGAAEAAARSYPCFDNGWCSEPLCCGPSCGTGSCPDGVWPGHTHIAIGTDQGCNEITARRAGGILCCKE
ncbi:MAG: LPP20 family lipoprotein [Deltaproteobacteria bacterium]|nr:LPP20 family lipoprotein [Deltaproteobacteria bacterium]